jgi:hypothetical protein
MSVNFPSRRKFTLRHATQKAKPELAEFEIFRLANNHFAARAIGAKATAFARETNIVQLKSNTVCEPG